jgi:hypothetical protein
MTLGCKPELTAHRQRGAGKLRGKGEAVRDIARSCDVR